MNKLDTAKVWFWIGLDVLIGLAAINLLFFVMPALDGLKNSFVPSRTITVSAQGKTTVSPDMAEISFSVLTQGKNPQSLSDDNNRKMSAVLQFVASQHIASSDVATTNYNLQPDYQWDKYYQRNTIIGYTLSQTVQVKVRDLSEVASVLAGLAPLGVNQIGGVQFTFQDPNKFVGIARQDALAKAKQQADAMASAAGTSLGSIVTVSENGNIPGPRMYDMAMSAGSGGVASAPVAPTIQPGTQDVTDTVTVIYSLR